MGGRENCREQEGEHHADRVPHKHSKEARWASLLCTELRTNAWTDRAKAS